MGFDNPRFADERPGALPSALQEAGMNRDAWDGEREVT